MRYRILCVGDVTIDAFFHLDKDNRKVHLDKEGKELCIAYGEKIDVDSCEFTLGGNAANVAVGLKRLGVHSGLCTEIGDDEFSLKILNFLAKEGIDRSHITENSGTPSSFSMALNYRGDRTLFVEHVQRKHEFHYRDVQTEVMYLTSLGHEWKDAYKKALKFCYEEKIKLVFNPGSIQLHEEGSIITKALEQSEILFVNKEEAMRLTGHKSELSNEHDDMKKLLIKVQLLGPNVVVITNGNHGSFCIDLKGRYYYQPVVPSEIVERTGAGDGYTAGFLAALSHDLDIETAMLWGSTNAASVVTKVGAQPGLLKREDMEKRVNR